jgi:hypothetical protein
MHGDTSHSYRSTSTSTSSISLATAFEQFAQNAENTAAMLGQYHRRLLEEGFRPEEALTLVEQFAGQWWEVILSGRHGNAPTTGGGG